MARTSVRTKLDSSWEKVIRTILTPHLARLYLNRVRHWLRYKGPEWYASRGKALWNMALLHRSGQSELVPRIAADARIGITSAGFPKGIEGLLVRAFAEARRPSTLRRAAAPLRGYTAVKLDQASSRQVLKAKHSITSPSQSNLIRIGPEQDRTYQYGILPWGFKDLKSPNYLELDKLSRLSGTSVYPSLLQIPGRDRETTPYLSMVASLASKGIVPDVLIERFGDFQLRKVAEEVQRDRRDLTHGKITILQEGGAKGRTVAMPNAWIQYYFFPFHQYLTRLIARLEVGEWSDRGFQFGASCVMDQLRGVYLTLNRLNNGSFCHCVDLSSATDKFPLDPQLQLAKHLGIPEMAEALKQVSGPWKGPDGEEWTYGVGQPMGLYGSFPLFHLAHYALLNSLCRLRGLEHLQGGQDNFAVLGDDVVIFCPRLLEAYTHTLSEWDVPINWEKSYQDNLVEFAGFVITKSRTGWTAFRPHKHTDQGFGSVLTVVHALGKLVEGWGPYWSRAHKLYRETLSMRNLALEPFIPIEPDTRKGDGFPGSRWIGSALNRAFWSRGAEFLSPQTAEAWETDRFQLLKEVELLVDIGNPGVTDPSIFDPEEYLSDERERKRSIWSRFYQDPLVLLGTTGE